MIQFNLLPDVKIDLMKARRTNRLVVGISVLVVSACLLILGIMLSISLAQKKHLSDLNDDISAYSNELNSIEDLTKILTIQNQLNSLPALYDGRPAVTRLSDYLDQTTPATVITLSSVKYDFSGSTAEVTGNAKTLEALNVFIDTLKFTTFTTGTDAAGTTKAFNNVVLSAFTKNSDQVSFTVKMSFDPLIFDGKQTVKLSVPSTITTRSQTSSPASLFNSSTTEKQQ